jgi:hypothetical protein
MSKIDLPEFKSYEEEAAFWDNLDTADFMPDDDEWFHFDTANQRAVRIAVLPSIAANLRRLANARGVSVETLVNVILAEHVQDRTLAHQPQ